MDGEVDFEDTADFEWTVRAFEALEGGRLHGKVFTADGVVSTHVWGRCPRCAHPLDDRQVHTAVITGPSREADAQDEPPALAVDIACQCGHPHPQAPDGVAGCGVSFRVELVLG
ncbi:hypothetical protein [Actinokineospora cianjurensis]|uniref:Uncharacterized protein n=1 Tax=Actinokineospora cianjurensis TaxID=585224 RepID=A0A421B3A4_9PSEU|nr:hypothetical protein [Actinokineospora cianjurensis]RLK58770.1 hypothetical protein CLV68_3245 [Actinokineospora cianjurensis]